MIMAEYEMASIVSTHTKPYYMVVSCDGKLTLDFTFEEQIVALHDELSRTRDVLAGRPLPNDWPPFLPANKQQVL